MLSGYLARIMLPCCSVVGTLVKGATVMLWGIVVVLLVLWLLGFLVVHITSGLIHLLLLVALIVLVYNLVVRSRSRV